MRIIETSGAIIKLFKPEFGSYRVKLNKDELAILQKAQEICDKAGELQTKIIEKEGIEDDGTENDFSWAEIYLKYVLRDQQ